MPEIWKFMFNINYLMIINYFKDLTDSEMVFPEDSSSDYIKKTTVLITY